MNGLIINGEYNPEEIEETNIKTKTEQEKQKEKKDWIKKLF